jgi:hypothetical protein
MSTIDNARVAADALEAEWRGAEHVADVETAAVAALRALIAEHERVLAHPLLTTVDVNASVVIDLADYPADPTADEWEYGVREDAATSYFGQVLKYHSEAVAREVQASADDFTLVRRRSAGEWEEVTP